MCSHNIYFYGELEKIIPEFYHQIHLLNNSSASSMIIHHTECMHFSCTIRFDSDKIGTFIPVLKTTSICRPPFVHRRLEIPPRLFRCIHSDLH